MREAVLAYLHLIAILTWVVFIGSSTALTRAEWLNAAALQRLALVDRLAAVGAIAVLVTGTARVLLGVKGPGWYLEQPLLWGKFALWVAMVAGALGASRCIQRWQRASASGGGLPAAHDVAAVRRRLMAASHLMLLAPLLAIAMARGIGVR